MTEDEYIEFWEGLSMHTLRTHLSSIRHLLRDDHPRYDLVNRKHYLTKANLLSKYIKTRQLMEILE